MLLITALYHSNRKVTIEKLKSHTRDRNRGCKEKSQIDEVSMAIGFEAKRAGLVGFRGQVASASSNSLVRAHECA